MVVDFDELPRTRRVGRAGINAFIGHGKRRVKAGLIPIVVRRAVVTCSPIAAQSAAERPVATGKEGDPAERSIQQESVVAELCGEELVGRKTVVHATEIGGVLGLGVVLVVPDRIGLNRSQVTRGRLWRAIGKHRPACIPPAGVVVRRPPGTHAVLVDEPFLRVDPEGRGGGGSPRQRNRTPLLIIGLEVVVAVRVLIEQIDTHAEFPVQHAVVRIQRAAPHVETPDAGGDRPETPARIRLFSRCIDYTTGPAHAKEQGVGSAGDVDALHVVGVAIQHRPKIVARLGRLTVAAHLEIEIIPDEPVARIAAVGCIAGVDVVAGVDRVLHRSGDTDRRDVVDKVLRHH